MPTYSYECQKCKTIIDTQKIMEMRNKKIICPNCWSIMKRVSHYDYQAGGLRWFLC